MRSEAVTIERASPPNHALLPRGRRIHRRHRAGGTGDALGGMNEESRTRSNDNRIGPSPDSRLLRETPQLNVSSRWTVCVLVPHTRHLLADKVMEDPVPVADGGHRTRWERHGGEVCARAEQRRDHF